MPGATVDENWSNYFQLFYKFRWKHGVSNSKKTMDFLEQVNESGRNKSRRLKMLNVPLF